MSLCPDMRGFSCVVSYQFIMSTRAGRRVAQCHCNAPLFAHHAIGPATHHPPQGQWHRMSIIYTTNLSSHTILLWKESDPDPLHAPFQCQHKINCILYFAAFPPRPARVSADHNISSHLRGRGLHDKTGKQRTVTQVNNWSYCIFQIYRQFYWPWELQKVGWLGNNDRVVALIFISLKWQSNR